MKTKLEILELDTIMEKGLKIFMPCMILLDIQQFLELRTGRFIKILSEPVSTIPEVEMPGSRVTIGTWLGFRKRSL